MLQPASNSVSKLSLTSLFSNRTVTGAGRTAAGAERIVDTAVALARIADTAVARAERIAVDTAVARAQHIADTAVARAERIADTAADTAVARAERTEHCTEQWEPDIRIEPADRTQPVVHIGTAVRIGPSLHRMGMRRSGEWHDG